MTDKRYYWIKLKTDFFDLPTIDWMLEQDRGCEYVVLYQKLCLLTANNGGELSRKIGEMIIPYEPKKIAEITKFSIDTVSVALALYQRLGLIYQQDNGMLAIADIDQMVGSETKWAEKKRLQRGQAEDNVPALSYGESTNLSENGEDTVRQEIESRDRVKSKKERTLAPSKNAYGEKGNVKLTDDEYSKLTECYGVHAVDSVIEALSLYIDSSGKKYKSHYATLVIWMKRDGVKKPQGGGVGRYKQL